MGSLASVRLFLLATAVLAGCASSRSDVDGAVGAGSGAAPSSGGASSGGASSGGEPSSPSGGAPDMGGSGSGGSATPVVLESDFATLDGFQQATKTDLLPGATASITNDAAARDGHALSLSIPGNAAFDADSYVGPGAHAIEVVTVGEAQLYGRYEMSARFASCAPGEELVNGLFTYFNDGSDEDDDGIADNSEIDIEVLCGEPRYLWLTVWTDYQATPTEQFRKTTRVIDMTTGAVQDTPLGTGSYGGLVAKAPIPGLAIADFPRSDTYYHLGFEWRRGFVRYFIVLDGKEVELWNLEGEAYVPQRPAHFLLNLWHSSSHWYGGGAADYPAGDASLLVDWVEIRQ